MPPRSHRCRSRPLFPGALADPRPDAFEFDGNPGPAEDLAVLDRIHVIPRRRDLGAVVSEQEIEVEVWNAFLARARMLDEITVEGPAGIEVVDHLGQPAHFPASDSQVYRIKVYAEGDPLIDNLITWVFVDVDPSGTNIRILGFRLIPFPFPPNWAEPVVETFGYLTDLLQSFRGMEQRVQLRAVPVGSIAYSVLLNELRDAQMAGAILFGNQARAFGIARWQFRVPLLQDALADDLEVFCDTTDIPFEPGVWCFSGPIPITGRCRRSRASWRTGSCSPSACATPGRPGSLRCCPWSSADSPPTSRSPGSR